MSGRSESGRDLLSDMAGPGGALVALVLSAALTPLRDTWFGATNSQLLLVVVIASAASLGGRRAGAVTAAAAALAYNYFLTRPYYSLHIDDPRDVTGVILLLVVGLVIGEFARARGRTRHRLTLETDSVERLERIASLLVSERTHAELCDAVSDELRAQLALASATWVPVDQPTGLPVMERSGWIATNHHHFGRDGYLLPEQGIELPVEFAGARLGAFALVPIPAVGLTPEQRRVAVAISDLLASALARTSGAWRPD